MIKEVSMNHSIYSYSLCVALPLMLFFGFYFLFGRTPDKAIFFNYLRSRRIMGTALLLLAANYSVHFFFEIRYRDVDSAIIMNLSTYFLCYWLFSSALTTLLNRFYITRRRVISHLVQWIFFTVLSAGVLLFLPDGRMQSVGLSLLASWLVVYGIVLAMRLIKAYKRAVVLFENTHSDDIGTYIRWLSIFTWWAVIFGVGCGLLTFLPDEYVFIWILSSVLFYIYLFCSYMNYLLFYEQVESVFESEMSSGEIPDLSDEQKYIESPLHYVEISEKMSSANLVDVTLPDGLKTIGKNAFCACNAMTTIDLPAALESIGQSAFSGCSNLATVTCRAMTPPSLGENAFRNCVDGLQILVPSGSVDAYKQAFGWTEYVDKIKAIP